MESTRGRFARLTRIGLTESKDDLPAPTSFGDDPVIRKGIHMAWVILALAGLFEVVWAIGLKYTEGFTRLWPTVWTVAAMVVTGNCYEITSRGYCL